MYVAINIIISKIDVYIYYVRCEEDKILEDVRTMEDVHYCICA
jgi:hypothetical protein